MGTKNLENEIQKGPHSRLRDLNPANAALGLLRMRIFDQEADPHMGGAISKMTLPFYGGGG